MKIQFQCNNCQSVLRLDAEHEGKQARCPVCGVVTLVSRPAESDGDESATNKSNTGASDRGESDTWAKVEPDNPSPPAASSPAGPAYDFQSPLNDFGPSVGGPLAGQSVGVQPPPDGFWVASLILGIISILSPCSCGVCGSPICFVTAIVGLTLALFSKASNRWICLGLNALGLILGFIFLGMFALAIFA